MKLVKKMASVFHLDYCSQLLLNLTRLLGCVLVLIAASLFLKSRKQ